MKPTLHPRGLLRNKSPETKISNTAVCWTDKWVSAERDMAAYTSPQQNIAIARHLRAILLTQDSHENSKNHGQNRLELIEFLTLMLLNYADAMVDIKAELKAIRRSRWCSRMLRKVLFPLLALSMCVPPLYCFVVCCFSPFVRDLTLDDVEGGADEMGLTPSQHLDRMALYPWSRKEFIALGSAQLRAQAITDCEARALEEHKNAAPSLHHLPYRSTHNLLSTILECRRIPWNQDEHVERLKKSARLIEEKMEMNGVLIFTNPDAYQFTLKEARGLSLALQTDVLGTTYAQDLVDHFQQWRGSTLSPSNQEARLLAHLSKRGVWLYCWMYAFYCFCQQVPSWETEYDRPFLANIEDDNTYRVVELTRTWKKGWDGVRLTQVWVGTAFLLYLTTAVLSAITVALVTISPKPDPVNDTSHPDISSRLITLTWVLTGIVMLAVAVSAYNNARRAFSLLSFSADVYDNLEKAAKRIGNVRMSVAISIVYLRRLLSAFPDQTNGEKELACVTAEAKALEESRESLRRARDCYTIMRTEHECLELIKALANNSTVEVFRIRGMLSLQVRGLTLPLVQ